MKQSDINNDGPELSCPYLDGVIKKYPDTATTLEHVRTINSQLRYDRNGYAEMFNEIKKENEKLTRKLQIAKNSLISISINSCCDQCQEAKLVALSALKELE